MSTVLNIAAIVATIYIVLPAVSVAFRHMTRQTETRG
jgi:hypothetical protein